MTDDLHLPDCEYCGGELAIVAAGVGMYQCLDCGRAVAAADLDR